MKIYVSKGTSNRGSFTLSPLCLCPLSAGEEDSRNYKLVVILVLAGLTVLFIIQNVAVVEIQFLFWSIQISRSILIFFLLANGVIIGWFLHNYLKYVKVNLIMVSNHRLHTDTRR